MFTTNKLKNPMLIILENMLTILQIELNKIKRTEKTSSLTTGITNKEGKY